MTDTTQRREITTRNSEEPSGVADAIGHDPRTMFRRVGLVLLVGMVVWLFLAVIVIPTVIQIARRTDIPLLSNLMAGRATTPVSEYLNSWNAVAGKISSVLVFTSAYVLSMATLCAFATSRSRSMHFDTGVRGSWFQPAPVLTLFCFSSVTALFIIHYFFPVTYVALVIEDGWIEQVQFLSWFTIAFLLVWLLVARKGSRLGIALFAIVGFVFAMEEISWGQRLLGFSTPASLTQYNYQNELNIHNITAFYVSNELRITPWHVVGLGILAWTFLLPAAFRFFPRLERLGVRTGMPSVPKYLWPVAITAAFFLLFDPLVKGREIGELGAALFSVMVALAVVFESSCGDRRPGPQETMGFTALIVVVFGLAALSVFLTEQSASMRSGLNRMAARHLPAAQMYEQAQVLFEYIETHPEYRSERSRLNYADVLGVLGRHDEARSVLERDLAAQADRTDDRALRSQDHRITGEILGRLSREDEATQALTRALELDHAALSKTTGQNQYFRIRWSLAKTYSLLKDTLAVAEHIQAALETSSARDRQVIETWLRENEFSHLVTPNQ